MDRPTRFIVAWSFGPTEDRAVPAAVARTRARTKHGAGVPWLSDGRAVYAEQIRLVYRDPVRTGKRGRPPLQPSAGMALTQTVKQRVGGRLVRVTVRPVVGTPPVCPYTVYIERLNGELRDRLNCLTRKTHGFAKTTRTWDAAVTLQLFEHNWLRAHPALRVALAQPAGRRRYEPRTPAMAVRLTDHLWSWDQFLTHRVYQYH